MTSPGASVCVCVCGPLLRHQSVQLWAGSGAWLTSRGIVINHFNAALLVSTSIWAADNVRKGDWLNIASTDEEDISRLLAACVDGSYSETKPKQNKEIPQNNEDLVETSCKCHSPGRTVFKQKKLSTCVSASKIKNLFSISGFCLLLYNMADRIWTD